MRIVFLGTPDFAAFSLEAIINADYHVVAVITAPDKKAGRGQNIQESAVKQVAVKHQIPCLQPKNLKDDNFLDELKAFNADLQLVVAFRMLPEIVWNMPPKGTMNLHASLLPLYRGAAPINWAIINGEESSGVTTFLLKHEIDTGEVIRREEVKLDARETAGSLHDKLMKVGAQILVESVSLIESDAVESISQEELIPAGKDLIDLPKAPKIFREDCKIEWKNDVRKVDQMIRGLSPYPAAWTQTKRRLDGRYFNLKIYNCIPTDNIASDIGDINSFDNKLFVSCADKQLEILELQLEGKKRMLSKDFLNGINLDDYESKLS